MAFTLVASRTLLITNLATTTTTIPRPAPISSKWPYDDARWSIRLVAFSSYKLQLLLLIYVDSEGQGSIYSTRLSSINSATLSQADSLTQPQKKKLKLKRTTRVLQRMHIPKPASMNSQVSGSCIFNHYRKWVEQPTSLLQIDYSSSMVLSGTALGSVSHESSWFQTRRVAGASGFECTTRWGQEGRSGKSSLILMTRKSNSFAKTSPYFGLILDSRDTLSLGAWSSPSVTKERRKSHLYKVRI